MEELREIPIGEKDKIFQYKKKVLIIKDISDDIPYEKREFLLQCLLEIMYQQEYSIVFFILIYDYIKVVLPDNKSQCPF